MSTGAVYEAICADRWMLQGAERCHGKTGRYSVATQGNDDDSVGGTVSEELHPGNVITPEAVLLEFSIAGLATRLFAKVADVFCLFVVMVVVTLLVGVVGVEVLQQIVLALSVFFVSLILPALWEWYGRGRTFGKAMTSTRVISVQGGPVTFRQCFIRNLVLIAEMATGVGPILMLTNPNAQRFGDIAAGTMVIKDQRLAAASTVPTLFYPPPGWDAYVRLLDVGRVSDEDVLLIRNFLLRVRQLRPAARSSLDIQLASYLAHRVAPVAPPLMTPEDFLICVVSACQIRSGTLVLPPTGSWSMPPQAPPTFRPTSPIVSSR